MPYPQLLVADHRMIFISLGNACNVKYQIDTCIGKKETLFFDWLMTDIPSIIRILKHYNNIHDIMREETLDITEKWVDIKGLSWCRFIHDIMGTPSTKEIREFIDKYKRRLDRIIDYIKADVPIVFIRYGDRADEIICNELKELLMTINPHVKYIFANLYSNSNIDETPVVYNHNLHTMWINIETMKRDTFGEMVHEPI